MSVSIAAETNCKANKMKKKLTLYVYSTPKENFFDICIDFLDCYYRKYYYIITDRHPEFFLIYASFSWINTTASITS